MIAAFTSDGALRVFVTLELPLPNAEAGQWDEARIAKLVQELESTVKYYVEAAEFADAETRNLPPMVFFQPRESRTRHTLRREDGQFAGLTGLHMDPELKG